MTMPVTPTIIHNGKSRPTINSRGEPIADNDEKLQQFWDWFSDSQSVDAEGRPIQLFRCQRLSHPSDRELTDRYYTADRNYALSYYKNEHQEHILQFYVKTESLSKQEEINRVTDFSFYDLNLIENGFDAVSDVDIHVFVAVGGDHQFRHAGEFNSAHAPLHIPQESCWKGKPQLDRFGSVCTPIVGKSGDIFMPGYERHRPITKDNPNPRISVEWHEPRINSASTLLFAKVDAMKLVELEVGSSSTKALDTSGMSL